MHPFDNAGLIARQPLQAKEDKSLPVLRGPVDRLRDGAVAFKDTEIADHPVETIQKMHIKNEYEAEMYLVERIHGQHAAWERRMDRAVLSQIQRLPGGPPSSHALLDTLLGRDEKIGVEDFLNRPENRPTMPRQDLHAAVEAKLNM